MFPRRIRRSFEDASEHVVYTSQLYADLRSRLIRVESAMIDFSRDPHGDADHRAYRAAQLMRPFSVDTPRCRVGNAGDGGYVMVDSFGVRNAVSLGVGPDVSWDRDIASRGVAVSMFDPTIDALPEQVPGARFHRIGLGTAEQARALGMDLEPFDRILKRAAIYDGDALLKVDIEGAEWDALVEVGDFSRFSQVVLELHSFSRLAHESSARNVLTVLEVLHRTHIPIHIHGNNEGQTIRFGHYWLPDIIEISYVRRDVPVRAKFATSLDTSLDAASNARYADLDLSGILDVDPIG